MVLIIYMNNQFITYVFIVQVLCETIGRLLSDDIL